MRAIRYLEEPAARRLRNALLTVIGLWVALACGMGSDDRMVRRYAECLADTNTALHWLKVSSASGTVPLSAEAVEELLRAQLERGEPTLAKIRADHVRYCE